MKKILLTFDLEEFDLPKEFNINLSEDQMYKISLRGLNKIQELLKKHNLTATFFTTANFAKKYPKTIKQLSKDNHEIASHGYSHSQQLTLKNLKEAKEAKETDDGGH